MCEIFILSSTVTIARMAESSTTLKQEKFRSRLNICSGINITLLSFLIASIGFNIRILTTDSYWSCELVKSDGNKVCLTKCYYQFEGFGQFGFVVVSAIQMYVNFTLNVAH